jgi:hypothetical protein
LGEGKVERLLLLTVGDMTLGDDPGEEGVVDGEVGEIEAGVARPDPNPAIIPVRWPVTGDVNGEVRGLRRPRPILEVVGNGAGTSIN